MEKNSWKRDFYLVVALVSILGFIGCSDLYPHRVVQERKPESAPPAATSSRPPVATSSRPAVVASPRPAVAMSYRFDDIPVPPGLTLNRKDSFVYETGNIKTGLLVYEGKGELSRLGTFFKEQMPRFQWKMMSNFELQNIMMIFYKEGWNSVIYILPTEGDDTKRIEIRTGPVEIKPSPAK